MTDPMLIVYCSDCQRAQTVKSIPAECDLCGHRASMTGWFEETDEGSKKKGLSGKDNRMKMKDVLAVAQWQDAWIRGLS